MTGKGWQGRMAHTHDNTGPASFGWVPVQTFCQETKSRRKGQYIEEEKEYIEEEEAERAPKLEGEGANDSVQLLW